MVVVVLSFVVRGQEPGRQFDNQSSSVSGSLSVRCNVVGGVGQQMVDNITQARSIM